MTNFAGVVEDTMQGHWRYQAIGDLACPVLSIAESPLKALENRQVGRAIAYSLETILRSRFFRIPVETKIGILGYGGIGEATAASLRGSGAQVLYLRSEPDTHGTCVRRGFQRPGPGNVFCAKRMC